MTADERFAQFIHNLSTRFLRYVPSNVILLIVALVAIGGVTLGCALGSEWFRENPGSGIAFCFTIVFSAMILGVIHADRAADKAIKFKDQEIMSQLRVGGFSEEEIEEMRFCKDNNPNITKKR
jgi:hypothetical protein